MCGIAGIFNFSSEKVREPVLRGMQAHLVHRGPDGSGLFTDANLGLAHRRLALIDLDPGAGQPMETLDRSMTIVYNGECYNFQSLRRDLETKNYRFRTRTDTEVVLYGMREYGIEFLQKMIGIFSFALWDRQKRELLIVRDRLGVKPLYFSYDKRRFIFASEIKPILDAGVTVALNAPMLEPYLSLRYCPGEQTLFKDIFKLSPGTYARIDLSGFQGPFAYWRLADFKNISTDSVDQASQRFFELFEESVSMNLAGDLPVGVFLSGGIDSSCVASLVNKSQKKLKTFTVSMDPYDESPAARKVATQLGIENQVVKISPTDFTFYTDALWFLEEPVGDSIIVPTYLLSKVASKSVKIVQTGEGADEILGGYVHQRAMSLSYQTKQILPWVFSRRGLKILNEIPLKFWQQLFPYPGKIGPGGISRFFAYLRSMDKPGMAYVDLVGLFQQDENRNLLNPEMRNGPNFAGYTRNKFSEYWDALDGPDYFNKLLQLDLRFWNSDYTQLRLDKLTMAHSLEARVPFLDHRLVEYCVQLPSSVKNKLWSSKFLLRKAMTGKNLVPESVRHAAKKPFHLNPEKCFGPEYEVFVQDVLSDKAVKDRGFFDVEMVRRLKNRNSRQDLLVSKQLMSVLIFELWSRLYLDGNWRGWRPLGP